MNDSEIEIDFFSQEKNIKELFDYLKSLNSEKKVIISGVSGTGKSFIAESLEQLWINYSEDYLAIYLRGDISYSERAYYPFITSISLYKKNKSFAVHIQKGISELSKGIPVAGDFVAYLFETLTSAKESNLRHDIRYLSDTEKLLINDFDILFSKKKLLVIVDNFQWLDVHSLRFIQILTNSETYEFYPFLRNVKYLFNITDDQAIVSHEEFNNFITNKVFLKIKTKPISKANYLNALFKFGLRFPVKEDIIDILYSFTGGNLLLIKKLADYLSENRKLNFTEFYIEEQNSEPHFIEDLLLYKLKGMGASGLQITSLLEFASIIGLSFNKEELLCLTKETEEDLKQIIKSAEELQLISINGSKQNFVHEVLRLFFLNRLKEKKFLYYRNFSACLTKLRPSDYLTRANFLFEGGNTDKAAIIYVLGALKDKREGREPSLSNLLKIKNFSTEFDLTIYLEAMVLSYSLYQETKFEDAIEVILKIEDWLPESLLAEKYYLLSLCLSKSMLIEDLLKAKRYLVNWDSLKETEGEIWLRIMKFLMITHINLYDFDSAKSIEKKIIIYLTERLNYDPIANYFLNIIRRNANAIHINEIAALRTQQSVEFFSKQLDQVDFAYPIQLYYSLINHSGNLLIAGEFRNAFLYASKSLELINHFSNISFPEIQIPSNNYILSGLLSNNITASQAANMFELINPYKGFVADEILLKNNYAVIQIYNDNLNVAFTLLSQLSLICAEKNIDAYYSYIVQINYGCLLYLIGQEEDSIHLFKQLKNQIPLIPEKKYLEKRHELLEDAIGKIEKNWKIWDNYLYEKYPFILGKQWLFFSKGFLVSDIQFWYEI